MSKAFDKYWESLIAKNPAMADSEKMTIKVESFKRQLQQAFEMGEKKSEDFHRSLEKLKEKIGPRGSPFGPFG